MSPDAWRIQAESEAGSMHNWRDSMWVFHGIAGFDCQDTKCREHFPKAAPKAAPETPSDWLLARYDYMIRFQKSTKAERATPNPLTGISAYYRPKRWEPCEICWVLYESYSNHDKYSCMMLETYPSNKEHPLVRATLHQCPESEARVFR